MIVDPRILIHAMRALSVTFRDWGFAYLSTAQESGRVATDMARAADEARVRTQVLHAETEVAAILARTQLHDAQAALLDAQEAVSLISATEHHVAAVLRRSQEAVRRWQHRLAEARAELAAARNELNDAQLALRRAEQALEQAHSSLNAAEVAYSRCRNSSWTDSQGHRHSYDCSSHQRAVHEARSAVIAAEQAVAKAAAWVAKAQNRVRLAEIEVAFCEERLGQASSSLATAEGLRPRVEQNHRLAAEATAYGHDAAAHAQQGVALATAAESLAASALAHAREADQACGQAHTTNMQFQKLTLAQLEAATIGAHQLEFSSDELRIFDDPRGI